MPVRKGQSANALPEELLSAIDAEIRMGHARSREESFEAAIVSQLLAFRRASVDRQFAGMVADGPYLAEAAQISEEFSAADWEALACSQQP
ncbi:MAG TPA: CopG family transcriptional regulator [Acidobacteria bacterium]|nr:CopG family transcriptional regulator [Acidobacteriota bacterium]